MDHETFQFMVETKREKLNMRERERERDPMHSNIFVVFDKQLLVTNNPNHLWKHGIGGCPFAIRFPNTKEHLVRV